MRQIDVLSYSVRLSVLRRYFGKYCLVLAVLTLPPTLVAFFESSWAPLFSYGAVAIGTAILGALLSRRDAPSSVQTNEAMILVFASFFFTSLVMAGPFVCEGMPFWDALFESTSACTTTGLTTLENLDGRSRSFLFTRAWMQWYGGLGIVVFSVALLVQPGLAAKTLILSGDEPESLVGNTRVHARRSLLIYGVLTVSACLILLACCRNWMDAITFSLAGVSTGGFAPHDENLAALPGGWLAWMLTLLACLAGAIPLALYERAYRGSWRELVKASQFRALLLLVVLGTLAVFLCLWGLHGMSLAQAARHAPLLAVSAQTTAGFSALTVGELPAATELVLILAMFVGGGLGSSAGGIKVWRLMVFGRLLGWLLVRTATSAHAVVQPRVGGHRLEKEEVIEASLIGGLFLALIFFSWIPFVTSGYDALDSLFEVVSATGTVGLSSGITGGELAVPLKLVLCLDMLLGRVEILAFLVVLYPRSWIGNRAEPQ
jgi:trk system potassium uptake protein TrkH